MSINGLSHTTDVLKRVRKEKGLTQKDVARIVGVNQSVISRIEAGEISASNRIAEGLEDIYGIPIVEALLYRKSWPGEPQEVTDIKQLIDRYQTVLSKSGISAIKAYVEHIVGLSNESSFTSEGPKIPKQSLWGGDWSWGPREMERYITSECAPVMTWNRISIHRSYPINVKGEEVLKGEIYVEGHKTSGTPLFSFFLDQIDDGGIFTGEDFKPVNQVIDDYFKNVIVVRVALPGTVERNLSLLMSGDGEYGLNDYYYLDAVVRSYLQRKGELGQSRYDVEGFGTRA